MPTNAPSLTRAVLVGSLRHFLAAVLVPLIVATAAAALSTRSLTDEAVWLQPLVFGFLLGPLFVFHESAVLAALPYLRHRRRVRPPQTSLATDLLMAAITTDLVVICLGMGALVIFPNEEYGRLWPVLGLLAPGLYGVSLLGRCIDQALSRREMADGERAEVVPPDSGSRRMLGLQVYVTAVVAVLAFAALGWRQDAAHTLGIAVVSMVVGRIVATAAAGGSRPGNM